MCACGIMWPRNMLRRSADGQLRCPDERGRDAVELERGNASGATEVDDRGNAWNGDGDSAALGHLPVAAAVTPIVEAGALSTELFGSAKAAGLSSKFLLIADIGTEVSEANTVQSWTDGATGRKFDATSASAEPLRRRALVELGGRSGIVGDGVNDALACSGYSSPALSVTPFYVLAVIRQLSSVAGRALLGHGSSPAGGIFQAANGALILAGSTVENSGAPVGATAIVEAFFSNSGAYLRAGAVEVATGSVFSPPGVGGRTLFNRSAAFAANVLVGLVFEAHGVPSGLFREFARARLVNYYGDQVLR